MRGERKATALLTTSGFRILCIERMLRQRRCVSFKELRAKCACSTAALKRDLRCMREELGAPIVYDGFENGYRLKDGWTGVQAALFEQMGAA